MVTASTKSPGSQTIERKKQLILIVDADPVSQFRTSIFLQRLDYHVFSTKTAEDALVIMELAEPSLILTDITLPQMSGIDLLKRLKQDRRTAKIPVLVYTAMKGPAIQKACVQAGCAGYLTHPADHNELYAAIQKATETTPRQFVRLDTSLEVIMGGGEASGGVAGNGRITAISENGMYVGTPNPLPFGAELPFTFFLEKSRARAIRVVGKVLYSHPGGRESVKNPGMGVKFMQIKPEDRELIRTFIKEKLMEGIAVTVRTQER